MEIQTDDEIIGTDKNETIFGCIGNNYLRGMAGDDVILGGEGPKVSVDLCVLYQ